MEGRGPVTAEVVGFSGDRAYLMPTGDIAGLALLKRREQKQTDDFASQQYARKRAEMELGEAR